jgi:hypothetical protein
MKKRTLIAILAALPVLVAGVAVAASAFDGAKQSTARFHDIEQAKAAGYTVTVADLAGIECINDDAGGTGAMGVHLLNPDLLFDGGTIDAAQPEILVYEPGNNGKMKLVALEYLVFKSAYGAGRPELFGRQFDEVPAVNRYGIPESWALHAWLWKPNPNGMLAPYNPRVSCAG